MSENRQHAVFNVQRTVGRDWVDYNGHMGDYAYAIAFSETMTAYMDEVGIDPAYREATGATLYTLDFRVGYQKECHEGTELDIFLHVLQNDARRVYVYMEMLDRTGRMLAWNQQVLLHVLRTGGKPAATPFPDAVLARLAADASRSAPVVPAKDTGRLVGLGRG